MAFKDVARGAEDAALIPFRAVGAVGNSVVNTYDVLANFATRQKMAFKEAVAKTSKIYSKDRMEYEALTDLKGTESFSERRKNRFGNIWKGTKNGGKWALNWANRLTVKPLKTAAVATALAATLAIGSPLRAVKDATNTVAGVVHDTADSVLDVGQQGADKQVYGFTNLEQAKNMSYADTKAAILAKDIANIEARKARKIAQYEKKIAALKGGKAEVKASPAPEKKDPTPAPKKEEPKKEEAKKEVKKEEEKHDTPPHDGDPSSSLSATVASLSSDPGYMGDVARIFSTAKLPATTVIPQIVEKISTRGKSGYGYVGMHIEPDHLYPKMQLTRAHENNVETQMHELLHYYTHPYLFAGCYHLNGQIHITNEKIRKQAISHYENITNIYERAKAQGYSAINGSSIEDTATEFVANLTHPESVKKLKDIGLYSELMNEVSRLVKEIDTVHIPFEKLTSGEIGPTGKGEKKPNPQAPSTKTRSGDKLTGLKDNQFLVSGTTDKAGEGFHGKTSTGGGSYGIVTTIVHPDGTKGPNTPKAVEQQIKNLYAEAKKHPDKEFFVGYTDVGGKSGSPDRGPYVEMAEGYSPRGLAILFASAGEGPENSIPSNVIFHEKFADLMDPR